MKEENKKGEYKKCLNCDTVEYIPNYRLLTHKFCSRSCSFQYKSKTNCISKSCVICNKSFEVIGFREKTAKYCSRECYSVSLKGKGRTIFKCQHCEKEFNASKSTKRKYCSKQCVNKSSKSTFTPVFTTVRKSMLRRDMISECNRCGYKEHPEILGVHHMDRNRKNNTPDNLEILCPNCHSLEHAKHIAH